MARERLFLIDGAAQAYRSYFALIRNPLTTSAGFNVSAVYGFATMLIDLLEREKPRYLAVVFDTQKPTFRNELYDEYKANRKAMPDPLRAQLPYIQRLVEAMNVPFFRELGFEADDLIGSLVRQATGQGLDSYIVTSDKDLAQLVGPHVSMYERRGSTTTITQAPDVVERWGVPPERMIDLLALMGDTSDNIPGIPGVGIKTAQKLLAQFGSFEKVIEDWAQIKAKGLRGKVERGLESALLSRKLVEIDCSVDVPLDLDSLQVGAANRDEMVALLSELEFTHLLRKFTPGANLKACHYHSIRDAAGLTQLVEKLRAPGWAFYVVAEPAGQEVLGLAFAWQPGEAAWVPLRLGEGPAGGLFALAESGSWKQEVLDALRGLLEDAALQKGCHDLKRALPLLEGAGIALVGAGFDSMLESYLYDPGPPSSRDDSWRHGLDAGSMRLLNLKKTQLKELTGTGRKRIPLAEADREALRDFACQEADFSLRLHSFLFPQLKKLKLLELYQDVELPLAALLARMELEGVRLDLAMLRGFSSELARELEELSEQIFELAGERFNIGSPKQLSAIIYDKLALHTKQGVRIKKTKSGLSTDQSMLELLRPHPLPDKLLRFRTLSKLKSTYTDALPSLVSARTGRIHTSFNQTATATGRLSSSEPNLQNIPIRTELGKQIRRAFVPRAPGWKLLSADYSQIELRILAHYSEDPDLLQTFREGRDIHKTTAAKVFGVAHEDVDATMRGRAKAVNFGLLYGMGPQRLARENGMELEEARQFIEQYFASFPTIRAFIDGSKQAARETCQVRTLLGRLRRLDEILSSNRMLRSQAESMAVNTPIQGSAADLIKLAMLRIDKELREKAYQARMVLQVHDELVFDVPEAELDAVRELVQRCMEQAMALKVTLKVDVGVGENWLEAH